MKAYMHECWEDNLLISIAMGESFQDNGLILNSGFSISTESQPPNAELGRL